jgi:hypothetical protein
MARPGRIRAGIVWLLLIALVTPLGADVPFFPSRFNRKKPKPLDEQVIGTVGLILGERYPGRHGPGNGRTLDEFLQGRWDDAIDEEDEHEKAHKDSGWIRSAGPRRPK